MKSSKIPLLSLTPRTHETLDNYTVPFPLVLACLFCVSKECHSNLIMCFLVGSFSDTEGQLLITNQDSQVQAHCLSLSTLSANRKIICSSP